VPIDFTVQVLTQGCWPEYKAVELSLPPEVTALEDSFKQFYLNSHNNRKLTWLYAWGACLSPRLSLARALTHARARSKMRAACSVSCA
jgi:hypothetical protein